jgi:hypothetical protein
MRILEDIEGYIEKMKIMEYIGENIEKSIEYNAKCIDINVFCIHSMKTSEILWKTT